MATEKIQIIVSDKGTVTVKKNIDDIGNSSKKAADGISFLKGALAAFLSTQFVGEIMKLGDANIQLTNALKTTGLAGQALADQQSRLFDIAKENGQSVNELTGIYQRLTSVQGQLEASGQDIDFTMRAIGASMKMSSANAAAQAGALQQLQQLFGGTNVQAQEFNALIDGAFPLLQAVAAGSERWAGSVAKLTRDVKAGTVTSKEFFDALQKGGQTNIDLAATFDLTIGQALTNFKTNIQQALLVLQNMTGIFSNIAIAINFFGNNLGLTAALVSPLIAALLILSVQVIGSVVLSAFTSLIAVLVSTAVTIGGTVIPAIVNFAVMIASTVIPAVISLTTAMLTNPLFMVGAAAAVAGVIIFQDRLRELAGTIRDTVTEITGLDKLGKMLNGTFNIDIKGDDFAAKAKAALTGGSAQGAPEFKKAIVSGAKDGADILKAGTAEAAKAAYEALNGVPQKIRGEIQAGADYTYNQVTGAYTKSGEALNDNIKQGGESAGSVISQSMKVGGDYAAGELELAGNKVGGAIAAALQTSAFQIANIIKLQMGAELAKTKAEANKLNVESASLLRGGGNDNSSSSSSREGNGFKGKSNQFLDYSYKDPNVERDASIQAEAARVARLHPNGNNTNSTVGSLDARVSGGGGGNVSITNVFDPNMVAQVNKTAQGQKTIVNVIRDNRDEIKQIMGIA